MLDRPFQIALAFDLVAVLLWAATGALAGLGKKYDLVGVTTLGLVTALAGGVLRDLLLGHGPPAALTDGRYLLAALAGVGAVTVFRGRVRRLHLILSLVDALGIGVYGVVGSQKALAAGLPVPAVLLVGTLNAVGGGLVRDVLVREEPLVFKPGEWYALAALAGSAAFVALVLGLHLRADRAAFGGIAVALATRLASVRLRWWRTVPVGDDNG